MASLLFLSTMNGQPWGGSEELWSRAAALLAREGHAVTCALYAWPEKAARVGALRAAGCHVRLLPNWGRRKASAAQRLVHEAFVKPAAELAVRRLPWPRFEQVVVSIGGWNELTWRPFRRLDRLARAYTLLHHSYTDRGPLEHPDDLRRLVLGARRNLFTAYNTRDVLESRLGFAPPGSAVIANPLTFVPPASPPPLDPGSGPARFAMLGTLDFATKGQDLVIDAFSGQAWRARHWRLDIYGDGGDRERLAALVRARGLGDRVALRGWVTDVQGAITGTHFVIQASRVEAVSIVLHEAMSLARPVLITPVGDMPRWVVDGETGFVAAEAEAAAVAQALEAAWSARARWAEIGLRARERLLASSPADPVRTFAGGLLEAVASASTGPGILR